MFQQRVLCRKSGLTKTDCLYQPEKLTLTEGILCAIISRSPPVFLRRGQRK